MELYQMKTPPQNCGKAEFMNISRVTGREPAGMRIIWEGVRTVLGEGGEAVVVGLRVEVRE